MNIQKRCAAVMATLCLLVCTLLVNSPALASAKVQKLTISKKSATLNVQSTLQLTATVSPADAPQEVRWTSSKQSVATVSPDGLVTAIAKGSAVITVRANNGKKATCKLTVRQPVVELKLNMGFCTVSKGKTKTLKPVFTPANASNKSVTFSSSNKKVATVSSKGVIRGKGEGEAEITVISKDGGFVATCYVTVVDSNYGSAPSLASQVVKLVNAERARVGLPALRVNATLTRCAGIRSKEISRSFGHTRPDGRPWYTVSSKANGENIAFGHRTADEVVAGWMSASGHRMNILHEGYRSIGVYAYRTKDGIYWVQLFGRN